MSNRNRIGRSTIALGHPWPEQAQIQALLLVSATPALHAVSGLRPYAHVGRGSRDSVSIAIDDPTVSSRQCTLIKDPGTGDVGIIHAPKAMNPTTVNGIAIKGCVTLHPGHLIGCGHTRVLAIGPWSPDQPLPIPAHNRLEFSELALAWYGSVRAAAKILDIDRKTLREYLTRKKSAAGLALLADKDIGRRVRAMRAIPEPVAYGADEYAPV